VLVSLVCQAEARKWWSSHQRDAVVPQKVKVSFDDESFSFWDPFKTNGFNASAVILPVATKVATSVPKSAAYAASATGMRWFLPPPAHNAVNLAYVAAALVRSHDVESFCKGEGSRLLGSPPLHLALLGVILRVVRFRLWRKLVLKAGLFRLRTQLGFWRVRRLSYVPSSPPSSLNRIFRDAAHAANNMQGLFPAVLGEMEVVARGLDLPYWPTDRPTTCVARRRDLRLLDQEMKKTYGNQVIRAVLEGKFAAEQRKAQRRQSSHERRSQSNKGEGAPQPSQTGDKGSVMDAAEIPPDTIKAAVSALSGDSADSEVEEKDTSEFVHTDTTTVSPVNGEEEEEDEEGETETEVVVQDVVESVNITSTSTTVSETAAPSISANIVESAKEEDEASGIEVVIAPAQEEVDEPPALEVGKGLELPPYTPLLRFHNVTPVVVPGSGICRSYAALAEFSGISDSKVRERSGESVDDVLHRSSSSDVSSEAGPGPWVVNVKCVDRKQRFLALDDVAVAGRIARRWRFCQGVVADFSGVEAELMRSIRAKGDLLIEAEGIRRLRNNLARSGMLGVDIDIPEVVSCPGLGPLAARGMLVTAPPRGVVVADHDIMEHTVAHTRKERVQFVKRIFVSFGHLVLRDGCFPPNPSPGNMLYMYDGQVGLLDLSLVASLDDGLRKALCKLYRTLSSTSGEDACAPSPAAEAKVRAAMEAVGLIIDLTEGEGVKAEGWWEDEDGYEEEEEEEDREDGLIA
ncbi:unnamed protein product, partial [Choristocarpus tenellus]